MKNILLGVLSCLYLLGCQSDSNSPIAEKFGDIFQIKSGEEAWLSGASAKSDLKVIVESITDSRCPEGVTCIWAGNAQVKLTLSDAGDRQEVDLCIGSCYLEGDQYGSFTEQDTISVTVASQHYEVILKAVLPYPTQDNSTAEKEAVLEISPN